VILKVDVTEEDIQQGVRFRPCECPIARAIARTVDGLIPGGCKAVTVWPLSGITIGAADRFYHAPSPEGAFEFIRKFDEGDPVQPISLVVDIRDLVLEAA
jgi:hypothetical protein